jgi:membrane fusion protein, heavy metal efflux system
MNMYTMRYFFAGCLLTGLFACGSSNEPEMEAAAPENASIFLSAEQMELAGIETGKAVRRPVATFLECSGEIDVPPQNKASVHTPVQGFVQDVRYLEGDFVKKGAVLAVLSHPDLIRLQREFLESKGRLAYLEQELKRKESLAQDDAIARKDQAKAASEFQIEQAHYRGIRAELQLIGLSPEIIESSGAVQTSLSLRAPVSGYITGIHTHLGQLADPSKALYEMIDPGHVHVELQVFAKDAPLLRPGQAIECWTPGSEERYSAKVHLVGREINMETRTVRVHGHFEKEPKYLLPGVYVQAQIAVSSDTVWALPIGAVAQERGAPIVFAKRGDHFEAVEIQTGRQDGGFIEVVLPPGMESETFAVKGAYYLKGAGAGEE